MDRTLLLTRIFGAPLMLLPEKASVIADVVLRGHVGESTIAALSPDGRQTVAGPARDRGLYRVTGGAAVIPIVGSLVNRGSWIGASSGLVSYEGLKSQFAAAQSDPDARGVILDMESPGGEAIGAFECADALRALAATKPVTAVVNGMCCSAAYAIASAATRIVTTSSGLSGSIGVVMLHADHSRRLNKEGVAVTLIYTGARKVDGNMYEPLSAGVRADLQREVDRYYDLFVATVALGRKLSAEATRATQGRVYIGQAAVDIGLCDEVGTIESAVADMSGESSPQHHPEQSLAARMAARHGIGEQVLSEPGTLAARMAERHGLQPQVASGREEQTRTLADRMRQRHGL